MEATENNYLEANRDSWNKRAQVHVESDFYDVKGFLEGNTSLKSIELDLLGDLSGKGVLHLQCHFGQDTISMARMGAKATGMDLSDEAIAQARKLAAQAGADAEFICCDVYDLPNHLDKQFDVVFTTYGTIGWLPDLDRWAKVISTFLKPGGKLVFAEFHPVVWMFDDHFVKVAYNYFKDGPIVENTSGTYADKDADIQTHTVSWNHSLGEVLGSLIANNISIEDFSEYDYSPYDCFSETVEAEPGKFRIKHLGNYIPMVYSVLGTKR